MYTLIITYEDITEVYKVSKYNDSIHKAFEEISMYGENCIEFVFPGESIFSLHEVCSVFDMVKRFDDSGAAEMYYEQVEPSTIDKWKKDLMEVADY
ncbi:hypothetical protein [Halobacillus litoralis]|uniref:hypothetical protein n=1 Tax=Halobacillus litoralis TaxID=45668 RepID=UPI001CD673C8|nr:hypothetical protein [Halobacillus litoralis]MCA1021583.1 hypothetical protein [Halobacillus litoralis]